MRSGSFKYIRNYTFVMMRLQLNMFKSVIIYIGIYISFKYNIE